MARYVLVQLHERPDGLAEVVVKDTEGFRVYAGNLILVPNPRAYYSPDEGDDIRARGASHE